MTTMIEAKAWLEDPLNAEALEFQDKLKWLRDTRNGLTVEEEEKLAWLENAQNLAAIQQVKKYILINGQAQKLVGMIEKVIPAFDLLIAEISDAKDIQVLQGRKRKLLENARNVAIAELQKLT